MDFVTDSTVSGRRFRGLAIVDNFSRECPAIEVDTSLGGARVVSVLERLAQMWGLPVAVKGKCQVFMTSDFVSNGILSALFSGSFVVSYDLWQGYPDPGSEYTGLPVS